MTDEHDHGPGPVLRLEPLAVLRARVAAQGPRRWLLRGVWPAGDYLGRATPQDRLDQALRCKAAADACRARAALIEHDPWTTIYDDFDAALSDVTRGDAA